MTLHANSYRFVSLEFRYPAYGKSPTATINRIPQFVRGIGVIQNDNRTSDSRSTKEYLNILAAISIHDPNTVAMVESRREEGLCDHPASLSELAVGEARRLPWHNQSRPIRERGFLFVDDGA